MGSSTKNRPRPEGGPQSVWTGDVAASPSPVSESDIALAFVWAVIGALVAVHGDVYFAIISTRLSMRCTFHETVTSLHIHSDNAGSHFKNGRTLNYLSRLKGVLQDKKVTWSFGCPGHGKGPWDGMGGLTKRVLRSDTIKQKIVIKTYQEVAAHLQKIFCTSDWKEKHKVGSSFVVNEIRVHACDSDDIMKIRNMAEVINYPHCHNLIPYS